MSIRLFKITLTAFFALAFLSSGLYFGSRIEKKDRAAAEAKSEQVQTIAVVNLDEGVLLDDQPVYYSNDFMIYPSPNFMTTGLEDARQGIHQGRYAAYVTIPASFSRSIASINGIPQKSTMEYAVNPNLEDGIRGEILLDIRQFQLVMNTNISYVYVSSILEEFHNTQDASAVVLKNDKNELEKISAIEAEKLLQDLILSEMNYADYNLDDLDVDQAFSDSEALLDRMGEGILADLEEGQSEFETVREQNDAFKDAAFDLFKLLEDITPGETLSGDRVYEDGLTKLEQTIDVFHTDQAFKRAAIANHLYSITNSYRTQGEEYLGMRLLQLQDEVNNQFAAQLSLMQEEVDTALGLIQQDNHDVIQAELAVMELERTAEYEYIQNYIDQQLELMLVDLKEIYEQDANQQLQDILQEIGYNATPSEASPSSAQLADAWILDESAYFLATPGEATPAQAYQIVLATPAQAGIDIGQSGLVSGAISGRHFSLKNAVAAMALGKDPATDIWITLQASSILFPNNFIVLPLLNQQLYHDLAVQIEELYHLSIDTIREILEEQVIAEIERQNEVHKTEIERMMDHLRDTMDDYEKVVDNFDPYLYVHLNEISKTLNEINQNIGLIDRAVYEKTDQDRAFVDELFDLIGKNTDILQEDMEKTNEQTLGNILSAIETIQTSRVETNETNTYLLDDFTKKLSYTRVGSMGNKEAYDFIVNPVSMNSRESGKPPLFQLNSNIERYLFSGVLLMAGTGGSVLVSGSLWVLQRYRQFMGNNSL